MRIYLTTQPRAGTHWLASLLKDIIGYADFHHYTERISWTEDLIKNKVEKLPDGEIYIFHRVEPSRIIEYINPTSDYVVSITRDVKDIMVSRYILLKYSDAPMINEWEAKKGGLTDIEFVNEYAMNAPFYGKGYQYEVGTWKIYNDGYTNPNYMLLTYEDLSNDIFNQLENICSFLKITKTKSEIDTIILNNNFHSVTGRDNGEGKPEAFFRKGIVGDYLNYLDQDVIDIINASIL